MKGIVLAAGKGTRLFPNTISVCKPLLPVYDKPLIYYPIATLMEAEIRDILIIVPKGEIESFYELLGDGSRLGVRFRYKEQLIQRGIADAFIVGKSFIGSDSVCLALGDNIFFGPGVEQRIRTATEGLVSGAIIFGYWVEDPRPFGVVEFDSAGKAVSIEEKPEKPKSNYIVPGLYFYDNEVVEIAEGVKPSARGEMEITSVNNVYLQKSKLRVLTLDKECVWYDAGTSEKLYEASGEIKHAQDESGKMIGCLEEIALKHGWIKLQQVQEAAYRLKGTGYGEYLLQICEGL